MGSLIVIRQGAWQHHHHDSAGRHRHEGTYIQGTKETHDVAYRQARRPWLLLIACAVLGMALAGCQQFWRDSGVWDLDGHRGLLLDVNTYYHRHAAEEGGRCRSPIMEGVSFAAVVEETDKSLVVDLHYRYRDFLKDGDDCDPKWRPLRCTIMRECTGFAAREFQIKKNETGYQVIDMSGSRRR